MHLQSIASAMRKISQIRDQNYQNTIWFAPSLGFSLHGIANVWPKLMSRTEKWVRFERHCDRRSLRVVGLPSVSAPSRGLRGIRTADDLTYNALPSTQSPVVINCIFVRTDQFATERVSTPASEGPFCTRSAAPKLDEGRLARKHGSERVTQPELHSARSSFNAAEFAGSRR